MKPDKRFLNLPKHFWANVRSISQAVGYTDRAHKTIRAPSADDMRAAMKKLGLGTEHLLAPSGKMTDLGRTLARYFAYRAERLNGYVEPRLMTVSDAKRMFGALRRQLKPSCPLPMNKQKGDKKSHAYFTCIINMLIEAHANRIPCDYDPRQLTTVTIDDAPLRTLARRIDGAFPSTINPVAVWEIKEYYYTTTFGSRVADGVYESLLDGMELDELRRSEKIDVKHYLMVDAHYTWWKCGRSYLCRIVDMMHMGYVDEVLFGREVPERLPGLVKEWVRIARRRKASR